MDLKESSVAQIADLLADTKHSEPKACLLIGAGASCTAGIGLAGDFIERIKEDYPAIYEAACLACGPATTPNYAQCMAKLPPATQVKLVRKDIDAAKTNWAHIGIARLERAGVIDTILTPNFDPLASRACALFNRFPAIYDLAGLRDESRHNIAFDKSFVKGSAIFHLHGQHTGFLLLNTEEKLQTQARRIRPVLDAVMKGKPVIIAGYSGENDPLIDQIAQLAPFNHGLFWVCRDDIDPASNVCDKLLALENCYVVRRMPSDLFFTELANTLNLEPPGFLATPFDHMLSVLDTLRPYSDVQTSGIGNDLLAQARQQLSDAASTQAITEPDLANIATLMATGQFESAWLQYGERAKSLNESERRLVAWSAIELGNALGAQAGAKQGEASDVLFSQATEKFAAALSIEPTMHEALNNWGALLIDQAKMSSKEASDVLFALAGEKFGAALSIDPAKHEALNNWGVALLEQAKMKDGHEADTLFEQAYEKLGAALAIKPDKIEALTNWGAALTEQAKNKSGKVAQDLFSEADKKYLAALDIQSNKYEIHSSWGAALCQQASTRKGKAASRIYAKAMQQFQLGEKIAPGSSSYNVACMYALQGNAEKASEWLRRSKKFGHFPGCNHLSTDPDFALVRNDPVFKSTLAKIGC